MGLVGHKPYSRGRMEPCIWGAPKALGGNRVGGAAGGGTRPPFLRGEEPPALPEHPGTEPVGLPRKDPADPMRPIGHHMMPAPSLPRGGPRLGLKTGSRSRRAGATGARMGVLGWLVASALCAAVRGESVPRDGAEAPGGFGVTPKLREPPWVSSPHRWGNGNAGQGGEGFLIGCAKPCAWSPRERRAAGWCSALKAWRGGGMKIGLHRARRL